MVTSHKVFHDAINQRAKHLVVGYTRSIINRPQRPPSAESGDWGPSQKYRNEGGEGAMGWPRAPTDQTGEYRAAQYREMSDNKMPTPK